MFVTGAATILFSAIRPLFLREIVDVFTASQRGAASLRQSFWGLTAIVVCVWISRHISQYANAFFEAKIMKELDERSFAVIQRQSIQYFEDAEPGALMQLIANFRNSFEGITDIILQEVGRSILAVIVVFSILLYNMPSFALLFGIWAVVFLAFSWTFVTYKYPFDVAEADANSAVSGGLVDSFGNHFTIKSFGREREEQKRINAIILNSYKKRIKSWLISDTGGLLQGLLMITAELGFIFWAIYRWERGGLGIGNFVFLQAYVYWILAEIRTIASSVRKLFTMIASAQGMADLYHHEPGVKDVPNARPLVISDGAIEIHGVSLRYGDNPKKRRALDGISIKIPSGQSLGVVGKTGAGKSTLAKVLLRLYDVDSGYIAIDHQDVALVNQESLRQQIATVPQKPQLFHRSIRDNIAFPCPDATNEDVIEVAKKARAWDFIKDLPDGLDALVGDRGVKLSGGECQRIAIARAMIVDPRILILDEATSALDSATEMQIQAAIAELLQGKTSLVIAHRLSTLMQLDRIIVLENGRIVEDGTHKELLEFGGMYAELWKHQVGGYLPQE